MKVGDKVRIINHEYLSEYIGLEGVIETNNDVNDYDFYVHVTNTPEGVRDKELFYKKELELIEERPERYASREVQIDPIVTSVMTQLLTRSQLGISKYGTTLEENNTDDFLQHLKEELMDAVLYIEKLQSK